MRLNICSDFTYFKMTSLQGIRFIGGFAMAGSINVDEYKAAKPDPIAAFAAPVMSHMNDDHKDSIISMVNHYVGVPCSDASIVSIDKLGMTVSVYAIVLLLLSTELDEYRYLHN